MRKIFLSIANIFLLFSCKSSDNPNTSNIEIADTLNPSEVNFSIRTPTSQGKEIIFTWMKKNLDVFTFRNGDSIPEAKTSEEWRHALESKQPAWCYYNNDPENGKIYGKIYNYYAVYDMRGLAPQGWHIPSDYEFTYSLPTSTDIFSQPGGIRGLRENVFTFYDFNSCYYWCSDKDQGIEVHGCCVRSSFRAGKLPGLYVRCIKGESDYFLNEKPKEKSSIKIGNQEWMTINLDVFTFKNGDSIPEAKTSEEWRRALETKQPAWCYYDNNSQNGIKYGKLYNWFAANSPKGIAPEGWHISTDNEWSDLIAILGGESPYRYADAAVKLKSKTGWCGNPKSTNESGFYALPGGHRDMYGGFQSLECEAWWWSFSPKNPLGCYSILYRSGANYINTSEGQEGSGFSIRCVKDYSENTPK